MDKTFYAHLVDLSEIEDYLTDQELKDQEREELIIMVKETIHYRVVSEVLSHLPEEHHEWFLEEYTQVPHKKGVLDKLKEMVEDIEEKITKAVTRIKQEIKAELESEE